ncbi:hypothetical protein FQR65_LT19400 [Abscondita terminalis]|nr:hypothetical protein FQR65_LT19400 [Abscondita terminalis]
MPCFTRLRLVVTGLTDTTCVWFHSLPEEDNERVATGTVGLLGEYLEAKVVNENNEIDPSGTPGELCICAYSVMLGYWGDEEKTKQSLGADRGFTLGINLFFQADGYGQVVGSLKDMDY